MAGVVGTNLKYEDPMRSSGDANLRIPGPNVAGVVRTNLKYEDPMRSSGDANLRDFCGDTNLKRPGPNDVRLVWRHKSKGKSESWR